MISLWLESIRRDVRFGVRQCRKDATPTMAALLSLSLAIGACTAAFALINALVLRPLPVHNPENLVYMVNRAPEGVEDSEYFSYPMFEHLRGASREKLRLFAMAYQTKEEVAFDQSRSQAEWAYPHAISGEALMLLGVKAALGRLLTASDDQAGRPPVAVLSHEFWTRRFAKDPAVLGRRITYRGTHLQIVGVAADGFRAQAAARFVSSLLYDVKASDASSVVLPIASLLAVCALSAAHPALWATRVDPVAALRDD